MNITNFLATIPLFKGLSQAQCDELAMIATDQEFAKGRTIFDEGEPGVGFFLVMTGLVKIYKLSPDGKEQIIHIFGPGEPFAEAAVLSAPLIRPTLWLWPTAGYFSCLVRASST